MINYLKNMKIKYPSLGHEKQRSSMDSAEAGCKWKQRAGRKPFPYSNCLIIALPVVSFLALGIYFILVDLKILASVLNSTSGNATNGTSPTAEDGALADLVIVLEDEANVTWLAGDGSSTTERPFVYSPTVPHVTRAEHRPEATTADQESSEGANCFSTRLRFCEGVLPYDVVQLPEALNVSGYADLEALLPRFQALIESNCSRRAREVVCAVLEPECQPRGRRQVFPCDANCRVVADDCRDVITGDPVLSEVFNCDGPWDGDATCTDLFRGNCDAGSEFQCASGGCIPLRWVCNGRDDCRDSGSDETDCPACSDGYFRCAADGRCIPMELTCDGEANCPDNSDESSC